MLTKRTNVEIGKKHKLTWVVERHKPFLDPEVVDWWVDHPKECMKHTEDFDGQPGYEYPDCAIEFVLEGEGFAVFEETMEPGDIDGDTEGEHSLDFIYEYTYMPPTYPDYEADYDIEIKKCPAENDTTASTPPAST